LRKRDERNSMKEGRKTDIERERRWFGEKKVT
jgi:hypothetical protein